MTTLSFLIGAITLIGLPYFLLIQRRKFKFKEISQYIGGEYISESIFKTGKIIGAKNSKTYTIEPIEVGDRAVETHLRTFFSIECKNEGMLLLVKINFFKNFPDWKNVYKLKEKKEEKDFIGKLLSKNYKYNSYGRADKYTFSEAQKNSIATLFKDLALDPNNIFKNFKRKLTFQTLIQIERNKIQLDIGELLLDKRKSKEIVDLLEQLSKRVEKQPVC